MQLEHGGRRVAVTVDKLVIGSGPEAGLQVEGQGVLAEHATVRQARHGGLEVIPAHAGAMVQVNGHRIGPAPHRLAAGDRIQLGDQEVTVLEAAAAAGAAQRLKTTQVGMPVLTPEMRAEIEAQLRKAPAAPPPAPPAPARRAGYVVIALAVALLLAYFFLFRG